MYVHSLTKYTVVNGSTVIVCKFNNVMYCIRGWIGSDTYIYVHVQCMYVKSLSVYHSIIKITF